LRNHIYITGTSGFVGRNLVPYLQEQGDRITAVGRDMLEATNSFSFAQGDSIIHLAGKAHDFGSSSNPQEYYRVNYVLTKQLYDAFLNSDAKKFIFISSVKAAADSVKDNLTEAVDPSPLTDYGKSKLLAEQYIQNQVLPYGKAFYILRPCMIHGPGNKGNLNLLFKLVNLGFPYPLAAFDNERSFLSIANFNLVINALLTNEIGSGIYNVADDGIISTNEVITIISECLGLKTKLWRLNPKLITAVARLGDYLQLPLNSERLKKMTENYVVSNEKIKHALRIVNFPVSSKQGLYFTINSFKK
jgi:nucleoside-diphosphate-sugar epimerase